MFAQVSKKKKKNSAVCNACLQWDWMWAAPCLRRERHHRQLCCFNHSISCGSCGQQEDSLYLKVALCESQFPPMCQKTQTYICFCFWSANFHIHSFKVQQKKQEICAQELTSAAAENLSRLVWVNLFPKATKLQHLSLWLRECEGRFCLWTLGMFLGTTEPGHICSQ